MTELKPLNQKDYDDLYFILDGNHAETGKACASLTKRILEAGFARPQSLTEKVNLEPLDEGEIRSIIQLFYKCEHHPAQTCMCDKRRDELAKAICQKFGKPNGLVELDSSYLGDFIYSITQQLPLSDMVVADLNKVLERGIMSRFGQREVKLSLSVKDMTDIIRNVRLIDNSGRNRRWSVTRKQAEMIAIAIDEVKKLNGVE